MVLHRSVNKNQSTLKEKGNMHNLNADLLMLDYFDRTVI